ncbi:MAG: type II toxin-antitoxin system mRNA interferase toxin, RelE/StbE family [Candidatus Staskawiczbacteria bacterium]|nr:type II toxin-antitoxin system mRNA interferase toxin, RelE/StbE family [Candidatus Staskawiczbacteria bacterium]
MIIDLCKDFKKDLYKLPQKQREQFYERLLIFSENPFEPILNNHQLHGQYKNARSINITGDIRAIYEQVSENKVLFLKIDNHNNLYN